MTLRMDVRVGLAAMAVLVVAAGVIGGVGMTQERARHRIVFEVTSGDSQVWEAVLTNIENAQKAPRTP